MRHGGLGWLRSDENYRIINYIRRLRGLAMANMKIQSAKIAAIGSCVPPFQVNNLTDESDFTQDEIRKFVKMVGVKTRYLADDSICCSDLCTAAADKIMDSLGWDRESVDALIMVTHTPDHILPATACIIQDRLRLSDKCACFDVGLGCSGYCYGLWLATMMLAKRGFHRVLLLVGETPARMSFKSDRSVSLLFGDAGSATALESDSADDSRDWYRLCFARAMGYQFREHSLLDPDKLIYTARP